MKYALIGCGRIAVNHVIAARANNLEIVALCDIVPEHIASLMANTDYDKPVEKYTDYKELLNDHPDLDLVSIATESGSHYEIAMYCIEKGINLIIEKPISMSIGDADLIIKAAQRNNVKVSACHQNRFNDAVCELKKALDQNRFGTISHGSINVRWNRNKAYYDQASWRGKWASDGGALMNQCIHGIDLLRWLLGDDVVEVYGATRQQFHHYLECEDVGMAVLKFANGAIGTIEGTVNVFPKNLEETLYVFGETGTVKLGGTSCNNVDIWCFKDNDDTYDKTTIKELTSNVYGNGHARLFKDMIESILEDRSPYVDAVAGRNALEIVLAIYKSQLTGMPVKLPLQDFSTNDMLGYFD